MLKELVAKSLCEDNHYSWEEAMRLGGNTISEKYLREAQIALNLFKAEVDKLTVVDDEAIHKITGAVFDLHHEQIAEAQFQHTKKQLLDIMGDKE